MICLRTNAPYAAKSKPQLPWQQQQAHIKIASLLIYLKHIEMINKS